MFMRNLMSMDVEEMVRAQPMDSVVLIGGCDKTVPALLMGAASAGVPAIVEVTGPMSTGSHRGERLGACTDCRRFWGRHRAGEIDEEEIDQITDQLVPSTGTCCVMGTASTMALVTEAFGMMLPGGASIPATLADRRRHAERTGRAGSGPRPKEGLTTFRDHDVRIAGECPAGPAGHRRLHQRTRPSFRSCGSPRSGAGSRPLSTPSAAKRRCWWI